MFRDTLEQDGLRCLRGSGKRGHGRTARRGGVVRGLREREGECTLQERTDTQKRMKPGKRTTQEEGGRGN